MKITWQVKWRCHYPPKLVFWLDSKKFDFSFVLAHQVDFYLALWFITWKSQTQVKWTCHYMSFHSLWFLVILCHFVSFCVILFHFVSFHIICCHILSFHVISSHFMPFQAISCYFLPLWALYNHTLSNTRNAIKWHGHFTWFCNFFIVNCHAW